MVVMMESGGWGPLGESVAGWGRDWHSCRNETTKKKRKKKKNGIIVFVG